MTPAFEVADVLNAHWDRVGQSGGFNSWQLRTLDAIRRCRTAALGSHVDGCSSCGHLRISYNSCRNRHCPKCQGAQREKWIQARESELLPVPYFHVVFTLPDTLNRLSLYKPKILYDLLFKISWSVLNSFGHDPKWLGAKPGIVSILHTNGQDLSFHPHIHCIVSGGGINAAGNWVKEKRANGNYLFPKPKMENEYKLYLLKKLQTLLHQQKLATADAAALKITLEYWGKVHIQNIHHRPPH